MDLWYQNNSGSTPSTEELLDMAESAGASNVPFLADDGGSVINQYERDNYIPSTIIIGPDLQILSVDEGVTDPGSYLP